MNGEKFLYAFQFKDDCVRDHDIESVRAYPKSLVCDRKKLLLFKPQLPRCQFNAKRVFVELFQEARPKRAMHIYGRANDFVSKRLMLIFMI